MSINDSLYNNSPALSFTSPHLGSQNRDPTTVNKKTDSSDAGDADAMLFKMLS